MSKSLAVVLEEPQRLALREVELDPPGADDVVVETEFTGVSAGTERLLYAGRMPTFPGMGYPLVPGYETVGHVVDAGAGARSLLGARVFVPGARCYGAVRGLHGGAAARLVAPAARVLPAPASLGESAVLYALAATALHAVEAAACKTGPALVVGHGVLGRLIARLAARDGREVVAYERNPSRREGARGYRVAGPDEDERRDYRVIYEVSGDTSALDGLVQRLARGGEIVLAGFYDRVGFSFPPAFMREATFRIAAQWAEGDLARVAALVEAAELSLDGLITHRRPASQAADAYVQAFDDPDCLKMVLDWRARA